MPIKADAIPMYVPPGTQIHLSHKRPNTFGRFQAVGELSTLDKKSEFDLLEAVVLLSKGAQKLFIHIVKHRNDCNCCCVPREHKVGSSSYKVVMRFYKEIIKANLLLNIHKRHYPLVDFTPCSKKTYVIILNPHFIKCRQQSESQLYWQTIMRAHT